MKFSISSNELLKKLQIVAGAIGSQNVLPILENFLFTLKGAELSIAATDLESTITTRLEVMPDGDGTVGVPAKILLDTLKALPEQPVTFTIDDEKFGIQITSSHGKYRLAGIDGSEFPRIPAPEEEDDKIEVLSPKLQMAITNTIFAASNDELRPAMSGVYFQVDFNKLTLVATDAHKLVRYSVSELEGEVSTSFIAPKKSLTLLKNILPSGDTVKLQFNKANAFFTFEDTQLACRLVDARYPDYNAVIPVDNPHLLAVNREDFQHSLRRIAIYSNKTTNQVVLNLTENSLTMSAQDLDFSNEATEQLNCTYTGDAMQIAFNAKFLVEMLSVLESDEVKIELSKPSRAGILLPSEMEEGIDILMLVMPVMLGN